MVTSRARTKSADPEIEVLSTRMVSAAEDLGDHRAIYDHVTNNILPSLQPGAACPPLHIITYAIRNILSPTLVYPLIPQLLNLVAHVDCVRCKLLTRLDNVLVWDDHYKQEVYKDKDISVLDDEERRFVNATKTDLGDQMRREFRRIVLELSKLDIYHTWFSPKCAKVEELLTIYFPSNGDDASGYLFQYGLSEEEEEERDIAKDACLNFLESYVQDAEEGLGVDPLSDDVHEVYPPPADEKELVQLTHLYLKRLESAVEKINTIINSAV